MKAAESSQKLRYDLEFGPCSMRSSSSPPVMLGSAVLQNLREIESALVQAVCCTA